MYGSSDPLAYVLERELASEPGKRFTYSGGTTHLLGVILERGTGRPLEEYVREVLFEPLNIEKFEWRGDFGGMPALASGLRLLPRHFLKLGVLFANQGLWKGRQVVPSAWLDEAMGPRIDLLIERTSFWLTYTDWDSGVYRTRVGGPQTWILSSPSAVKQPVV